MNVTFLATNHIYFYLTSDRYNKVIFFKSTGNFITIENHGSYITKNKKILFNIKGLFMTDQINQTNNSNISNSNKGTIIRANFKKKSYSI